MVPAVQLIRIKMEFKFLVMYYLHWKSHSVNLVAIVLSPSLHKHIIEIGKDRVCTALSNQNSRTFQGQFFYFSRTENY